MRMVLLFAVIFIFSACLEDQSEVKQKKFETAFEKASGDLVAVRIGISDQCILAKYDKAGEAINFDPTFVRVSCNDVFYVKSILLPKEEIFPSSSTDSSSSAVSSPTTKGRFKERLLGWFNHFGT